MARRSTGKRKAGFLGFQSSEIAFIEDEMAALAAEYGLQVDGEVAANVSKRKQAKKARHRKPKPSAKPVKSVVERAQQQQQEPQSQSQALGQATGRRVQLLALQVARLELQKQKAKKNADDCDDDGHDSNPNQQARILSKLRALLPEGGALGRCVVPGCNCSSGSRELVLSTRSDPLDPSDGDSELFQSDLVRHTQCKRCQHGALQHAVVVVYESDKKKDATAASSAASGLPSGGQRLLSALYALVRLVRVSGSVYASREWTRSSMALLEELLTRMKRQFAAGGTQNGQKSAGELQQEKQLVGELQTLAKRAQQAIGASGRDELKVELACLCDQMYFHCYYACIVLYGRGCAAVPAPDAHLRQLLVFAPESAAQLEAFLNRELVTDEDDEGRDEERSRLAVVESLALPLAEVGKSASDYKRALTQFEDACAQNPLLSIYHSRLQEGVRLFYEEGVGMNGEMDAVLANPSGSSVSASGLTPAGAKNSKKKPQKKHYRRERKAGSAGETEAADGTGKATLVEMPSYPLLAQWRNNCRDWCCHLFAYATPTQEALETVASYTPLVEMGAGTGYWSALLQQRDVDIVAYDKCPPSTKSQQSGSGSGGGSKHKAQQNAYHGQVPPFCSIGTGGPEVLKQEGMAGRNLLLCYPPPGDDMAVNCARFFQGECIVHIGEWQGDTGDRRFEKELETKFTLEKEVALPNWGNSAYHLTVWRRNKAGSVADADAAHSLVTSCFRCGQSLREAVEHGNSEGDDYEDAPFKRCVLCKTNVYCSAACATRDRASHVAEHAKRLVFLSNEDALDFDNDAHFAPLVDVAALDTREQDAVAKRTSNWRALVGGDNASKQSDDDSGGESGSDGEDDEDEDGDSDGGEEEQEPARKPARAAFAFNFSA